MLISGTRTLYLHWQLTRLHQVRCARRRDFGPTSVSQFYFVYLQIQTQVQTSDPDSLLSWDRSHFFLP